MRFPPPPWRAIKMHNSSSNEYIDWVYGFRVISGI
jgi:hypothetical protein